jgi:hypothetical protein
MGRIQGLLSVVVTMMPVVRIHCLELSRPSVLMLSIADYIKATYPLVRFTLKSRE